MRKKIVQCVVQTKLKRKVAEITSSATFVLFVANNSKTKADL